MKVLMKKSRLFVVLCLCVAALTLFTACPSPINGGNPGAGGGAGGTGGTGGTGGSNPPEIETALSVLNKINSLQKTAEPAYISTVQIGTTESFDFDGTWEYVTALETSYSESITSDKAVWAPAKAENSNYVFKTIDRTIFIFSAITGESTTRDESYLVVSKIDLSVFTAEEQQLLEQVFTNVLYTDDKSIAAVAVKETLTIDTDTLCRTDDYSSDTDDYTTYLLIGEKCLVKTADGTAVRHTSQAPENLTWVLATDISDFNGTWLVNVELGTTYSSALSEDGSIFKKADSIYKTDLKGSFILIYNQSRRNLRFGELEERKITKLDGSAFSASEKAAFNALKEAGSITEDQSVAMSFRESSDSKTFTVTMCFEHEMSNVTTVAEIENVIGSRYKIDSSKSYLVPGTASVSMSFIKQAPDFVFVPVKDAPTDPVIIRASEIASTKRTREQCEWIRDWSYAPFNSKLSGTWTSYEEVCTEYSASLDADATTEEYPSDSAKYKRISQEQLTLGLSAEEGSIAAKQDEYLILSKTDSKPFTAAEQLLINTEYGTAQTGTTVSINFSEYKTTALIVTTENALVNDEYLTMASEAFSGGVLMDSSRKYIRLTQDEYFVRISEVPPADPLPYPANTSFSTLNNISDLNGTWEFNFDNGLRYHSDVNTVNDGTVLKLSSSKYQSNEEYAFVLDYNGTKGSLKQTQIITFTKMDGSAFTAAEQSAYEALCKNESQSINVSNDAKTVILTDTYSFEFTTLEELSSALRNVRISQNKDFLTMIIGSGITGTFQKQ